MPQIEKSPAGGAWNGDSLEWRRNRENQTGLVGSEMGNKLAALQALGKHLGMFRGEGAKGHAIVPPQRVVVIDGGSGKEFSETDLIEVHSSSGRQSSQA